MANKFRLSENASVLAFLFVMATILIGAYICIRDKELLTLFALCVGPVIRHLNGDRKGKEDKE